MMRKKTAILLLVLLLAFSGLTARADGTGFADILRSVDYGDQVTYVIGDIGALYAGMKAAKASYEGITASEIFYNDYKEYLAGEYTFGIGDVYTDSEEHLTALVQERRSGHGASETRYRRKP